MNEYPMNQDQKNPEPPMSDQTAAVPEEKREQVAEALLFSAGDSVALVHIAKTLGVDEQEAQMIVEHLAAQYDQDHRGLRIIRVDDSYQMTSRPEYYPMINQMYASKAAQIHLTQTQLEVLAMIAYRQNVTRAEIDELRGVHSDAAVARLQEYGLIEEKGRLKAPGRPIQFGTTQAFLKYFGYEDLSQLPHLAEARQEVRELPNTQMDLADLSVEAPMEDPEDVSEAQDVPELMAGSEAQEEPDER